MPVQRTDLRDELTALIAAGRELSPDHDQALAEVFIDRLTATGMPPSRIRRTRTVRVKPRHLLGAAMLGLAMLTVGAVHPFHVVSNSSVVAQYQPAPSMCVWTTRQSACVPALKRVPVGPGKVLVPGKVQVVPVAPKVPVAPQAPVPKSGP